jgi:acyl-lipid omega-6 desaturase (Delta-12 desaturase)
MRARDWIPLVRPHAQPDRARAVLHLATTIVMFIGLYAAMLWLAGDHYPIALALSVPTACVMIRGFSIQHDCQHGSYFANRAVSDWVGRALCLVTFVPHRHHRRLHAVHHAVSGRLDKRNFEGEMPRSIVDFDLITLAEFNRLSPRARRFYRFLRHPIVIFTIVPLYLFLFSYRVPILHPTGRHRGWLSTQLTNIAIVAMIVACALAIGPARFFAVFTPTVACYVTLGVWMFYVQHQFEHTYWRTDAQWDVYEAALHSSSYLALPAPLHWLTGNIGMHHLHHLNPKIPSYRLGDCLRAHPALARINRVELVDSLRGLRLALWDEDRERLVAFPTEASGAATR